MPQFDVTIAGELNLDLILYGLPPQLEPERELLAQNMALNGVTDIEVRPEAMEAFDAYVQGQLRDSVFTAGCTSWYKNDEGRIVNNWVGAACRYWLATRRPRLSDYAAA